MILIHYLKQCFPNLVLGPIIKNRMHNNADGFFFLIKKENLLGFFVFTSKQIITSNIVLTDFIKWWDIKLIKSDHRCVVL